MGSLDGTIILVGPRKSGKSTIGREVSYELVSLFYDLDKEIVKRSGNRPIKQIIDEEGYWDFRYKEPEVLEEILWKPGNKIIATGGGYVLPWIEGESMKTAIAHAKYFNIPLINYAKKEGAKVVYLIHSPNLEESARYYESLDDSTGEEHRGFSIGPTLKIREVRNPYYKKISDFTVYTKGMEIIQTRDEVIEEVEFSLAA